MGCPQPWVQLLGRCKLSLCCSQCLPLGYPYQKCSRIAVEFAHQLLLGELGLKKRHGARNSRCAQKTHHDKLENCRAIIAAQLISTHGATWATITCTSLGAPSGETPADSNREAIETKVSPPDRNRSSLRLTPSRVGESSNDAGSTALSALAASKVVTLSSAERIKYWLNRTKRPRAVNVGANSNTNSTAAEPRSLNRRNFLNGTAQDTI